MKIQKHTIAEKIAILLQNGHHPIILLTYYYLIQALHIAELADFIDRKKTENQFSLTILPHPVYRKKETETSLGLEEKLFFSFLLHAWIQKSRKTFFLRKPFLHLEITFFKK